MMMSFASFSLNHWQLVSEVPSLLLLILHHFRPPHIFALYIVQVPWEASLTFCDSQEERLWPQVVLECDQS